MNANKKSSSSVEKMKKWREKKTEKKKEADKKYYEWNRDGKKSAFLAGTMRRVWRTKEKKK